MASRRSVLTRSPALVGTNVGATTSHGTPSAVSCQYTTYPVGPASSHTRNGAAGPSFFTSFRIDSDRLGITPIDRTSPSGSATATAIVSAWTSRPINRTLLMTGSFVCGSALCSTPTRSVTHELRIGAGRSIVTWGEGPGTP